MNRSERQNDAIEALRLALEGKQAEIYTGLPGIVESFDASKITASVQLAVRGVVYDETGAGTFVDYPLLLDVPVEFPNGGGFSLTFPVQPGDECTVEFQCRCFDGWWRDGGVQPPLESRMHDLSDAICRVGPRSQKRLLSPAVNAEAVQLRADDAQAHVSIYPDYTIRAQTPTGKIEMLPGGIVNAEADVMISLKAPTVTFAANAINMAALDGGKAKMRMQGDIDLSGDIEQDGRHVSTGDQIAGDKSTMHHTHPGDSGGTTGEPN